MAFLSNIGQENVLYDILERKNAFRGYKNKKFKHLENQIFPKRLTHGFGQKLPILPFFWGGGGGKYWSGKCFLRHCRTEKTPCQVIKTRSSESRKIEIFSNFNLLFWSEIGHFSTLFLRQYRPGKFVLRYSRSNKRLCRL